MVKHNETWKLVKGWITLGTMNTKTMKDIVPKLAIRLKADPKRMKDIYM